MAVELYHPGLHGVIAGETEISSTDGDLLYRGFSVHDLVDGARFLEVAHLLLCEELPSREQLADFRSVLIEEATLPEPVECFVRDLPLHIGPLDMLRSAVSFLGNLDPQLGDSTLDGGSAQSVRILARLPLLIGLWMRVRDGQQHWEPTPAISYAGNLFGCLRGREPTDLEERSLEAILILSAEHGFTTPTYAARVVTSAGGDLYSAITAALGTLVGAEPATRHAALLGVFDQVRNPDQAPAWVAARIRHRLPIPGFGSESYPVIDPRAALLERRCSELAEALGCEEREEIADAIERAVWEALQRPPTLEWPAARLCTYLGLHPEMHLPVFTCARVAGWAAHALEEAGEAQRVRPRARYRGAENCQFEPLYLRG
jgi:citrate synthase